VLEGKWTERYADAQAAKQVIIFIDIYQRFINILQYLNIYRCFDNIFIA
jgi:hypothetical protein